MVIFLSVVYLLIPTSNHNLSESMVHHHCVVYLLIPTSNHNDISFTDIIYSLYIFWFLHQTTTVPLFLLVAMSCISFDSYIKPQRSERTYWVSNVVYLLIPTSNHNCYATRNLSRYVVYLLIPTSNHNILWYDDIRKYVVYLLIPTSNHNWKTSRSCCYLLYIFWFLHQTTTSDGFANNYQKLYIFWFLHQTTTFAFCSWWFCRLYIFWFLHQTTTLAIIIDKCV